MADEPSDPKLSDKGGKAPQGKRPADQAREARLAAALRANLKRRKAAVRQREGNEPRG